MKVDPHSDTWAAVETRAFEVIEKARIVVEKHGTDLPITEFQRGRIAAAREILRLAEAPPAPIRVEPVSYLR